ncbi:SAG-related sequence [Besnoitia besnoiti]|uniref:SAG-related sequence n=1 Tax=Besnoitia besnoiti TaxID=94643 RepID=A0A2A9MKD7_BESBE|nr:SAG-related sequence [Besnoitia besnoiti]PFH36077.1 SAG-related sequence [Besnoitia besnoiti]
MLCLGSQATSRALQRQVRQQLCYSLRAPVVLSACLLLAMTCCEYLSAAKPATEISPNCVPGVETTCTCEENKSGREAAASNSATLSQAQNALKLECKPNLQIAPEPLKDKVCSAGSDDLKKDCDVKLSSLLVGNPDVSWAEVSEQSRSQPVSKRLTIPPENFPLVDEQFAVGCTENTTKKCKVTVTVEARPSVTQGQTVTCAYGAGSNDLRQAVKLSPTQNSFTLVCGDKGEVLPKNYNEAFCSSGLTGNEETCKGSYTSILPGYEANWWNKDDTKHSVTLSIPTDQFPAEEAKIVVGCRQKEQQPSPVGKESPLHTLTPTVCIVDVTIEASSFASLSSRRADVFGLLAGAAVMTIFAQHA